MADLLQACDLQVNKAGKVFLHRTSSNLVAIVTNVAISYSTAYDVADGPLSVFL